MQKYILITRDTDLWLIGPFMDREDAANYGATAERRNWGEDPRWQTIDLA